VTPPLARFAGLSAITVAVVCAVGAWPTVAAAGAGSLGAMAAAAALAFVGAVLGYAPVAARASAPVETRAQAWLVGLGIRMFLTLAALFAAWMLEVPHRVVLLGWTAGLYLALLALETVLMARSMRPSGSGARTPA
jgi:hypothetical protein